MRGKRRGSGAPAGRRAVRGTTQIGLALAALLLACGAEPTLAKSQSHFSSTAKALQSAGQTGPTFAWIEFCERLPQECAINLSEPAMIRLDQQTWNTILQVNNEVNRTILSVTDQDHWGVTDRWDYPDDGMGDCEDIQLLKRKLLHQAGLPRRALRMTVVIDEEGAGHAVLMVRTDRSDFILDNKRNEVLPWQETGYRYVKREGAKGRQWVWLGDQIAPVATANR